MINTIHFTGIKGVGMTALAVIAKEAGAIVTGSDVGEQFITDITLQKSGITPVVGFASEHVNGADLVITTGAHGGFDNPEVKSAKEKGIRVISLAEATGLVLQGELFGRKLAGISVAGTHGKTTTSALVATLLMCNDLDPSYFIGTSYIPSLGGPGHFGTGEYFVIEADEYATEPVHDRRPKFFWQYPKIAVFTNIELDHPDIYPDIESVRNVFLQFATQIASDGVLIANGDDHEIQKVLGVFTGRKITYGFSPQNDFVARDIVISEGNTQFTVSAYGTELGTFKLHIHGEHNCANALASIIVALEIGLELEKIKKGLDQFKGTIRRLEYKGTTATGAMLYDDYAHHPTEVKKTLTALRAMYRDKKIICVFQPHMYSRTQVLFDDFVRCFSDADEVVLTEVYASAREVPNDNFSSRVLAAALEKVQKSVQFLPTNSDVVEYLDKKSLGEDTVIVTMGAGNIYRTAELLAAK